MTDRLGDITAATYVEASLALHEQIVALHGCHPNVVDRLAFRHQCCLVGGTGVSINVILALPAGEQARSDNWCAAFYGDA